MDANGIGRIMRTAGRESAGTCAQRDDGKGWRNETLIDGDQADQKPGWNATDGAKAPGQFTLAACGYGHGRPFGRRVARQAGF